MNEELDEAEFYHQDFTTASDWEIFIAHLEEIINQWRNELENGDANAEKPPPAVWDVKSESITFVDFDFTLSLYRRIDEEKTSEEESEIVQKSKKHPFENLYDFEMYNPEIHSAFEHCILGRWYGLKEFFVLSPAGNVGITSETKIKVLLSSLYVVSGNMKCELPIFVQIREKWQKCYMGVYEDDSFRTNLEMVHLKGGPRLCMYLNGLLDLFRAKIVASTMEKIIVVSFQQSYTLTDFGTFVWKQYPVNPDSPNFDITELFSLPFGVTIDCIHSITLNTTHHHTSHRQARENSCYNDFEPKSAHEWSCFVATTERPLCLLGDCLVEFLQLFTNVATMYDVLGDFAAAEPSDITNPLDLLTESKVPTISTLLSRATRRPSKSRRAGPAPLADEVLVPMLYFLFPDAEEDSQLSYTNNKETLDDEDFLDLAHECRGFKTCATDSLLWRLCTALGHSLQSLGGTRAFCHLWYEFVQEMRYRWEKSISIPGIAPGYPDLRTCLIHQKLQMLNCCISRRQAREKSSLQFDSAEESSEEEDEFFDCTDNAEEEMKRRSKHSLWNQPVGRLGKFDDLKLLKTGDLLYIPITQEPVPKSEDQLEEDTDVLLKLGANAEGSELRAKMMSASLLSDMESFKAANPGSILEDFIRWYSPRDWIEDESGEMDEWGQKKGQLSPRMQIENNCWVQTWETSKPVPAHKQKRLFDDTREAEKVLHYLDSRNLSQICELLMPILTHVSIYKLQQELQQVVQELQEGTAKLRAIIKLAERVSREGTLQPRRIEALIQEVTALESKISHVHSLQYKFNPAGVADRDMSELIGTLVAGKEVEIDGKCESNVGKRLVAMFSEAQKNASFLPPEGEESGKAPMLPPADQKEIVMRVSVARPACYSRESPQFLRAVINKDEFRLVGAFSEDITFF